MNSINFPGHSEVIFTQQGVILCDGSSVCMALEEIVGSLNIILSYPLIYPWKVLTLYISL